MFLEVFDKLNVGRSQVIYVGDGERDIIAANATNIISVFASYGYIDPSENTEIWGYDLLINSTDDLKKLIDIFFSQKLLELMFPYQYIRSQIPKAFL
jgi:phosphoglycolate phosphatase-like HAD superfamily hydrolase